MYDFHVDKPRYFQMQYEVSKNYVIPFIAPFIDLEKQLNILEIGCAEAGVLKAFTELGHTCTGIELSSHRTELAKSFFQEELAKGQIQFINKNIYDIDINTDINEPYDLVILKDVIEHIHDQKRFLKELKKFLKPNGQVFFGFPPWQMPFGGHQQICSNKIAAKLPYYHLLPTFLYKNILKSFGESKDKIEELVEIKETGISIERFERILRQENYQVLKNKFFLINPIYKYKFNLTPKEQFNLLTKTPYVRNYCTTCAYYLVKEFET